MPYFHDEGTGYENSAYDQFKGQMNEIISDLWLAHKGYNKVWNVLCGWYLNYRTLVALGPSNLGGCADVVRTPEELKLHKIIAEWEEKGYSGREIRHAMLDLAMEAEFAALVG